jgi:tRNA pseudouridine38-40 synthase
MNSAAEQLLGLKDFSTFIKPRPGSTNIRELKEFRFIRISRFEGIYAHLRADAFGHNMVRSLIKSLLLIGQEKKSSSWLLDQFNSQKRIGETGPIEAKGLTLQRILYPSTKARIIAQNTLTLRKRQIKK